MKAKFARDLHGGETGPDVEGIARALARAGFLEGLPKLMSKTPGFRRTYNRSKQHGVDRVRASLKLPANGAYDRKVHAELNRLDAFDAYAKQLVESYRPAPKPSKQDQAFARLLASMQWMSDETPGYLLGGGHGVPLKTVRYDQKLDCSSSTSKALFDAGLFEGRDQAIVSGLFDQWGLPGKGTMFTVHYSPEHVWVRLHRTKWWRFDTSPHGDGGRGPRLRMLPRFTRGFQTRHFPGM